MSLRINVLVGKIPKILGYAILLIIAGCLVKVFIWERAYIAAKEGTKRQPIQELGLAAPSQEQEIDETEITQDQIQAHNVSPDKPKYLTIPALNITNARIREVGLTKDGAMATLASIFDVGWYRHSGKPGQNSTIVINGHNGGPTKSGVFKHLDQLKQGDLITITRGDNIEFVYEVHTAEIIPLAQANQHMATLQTSPVPGKEALSIISCTGEWSQSQRTYMSRAMIRAVLVEKQ